MVTVGPFPSQLLWNVDAAQPSVLACQHLTNLLRPGLRRTGSKYEFNWPRYLLSRLARILDEVRALENIKKKKSKKQTETFAIVNSGPGAIIGVGDRNRIPCPLMGLVQSK